MKENMKKLFAILSGWTALAALSGYFFQLSAAWETGLILAGMAAVSAVWYGGIRRKRAERAFYEMTGYMEQLLCSYGREQTILKSLEDCMVLYPDDSQMGKVLRDAVYQLQSGSGNGEESVISSAFHRIYRIYPCERLKLLHTFIENISQMGGEYRASLDILLRDLQLWKRRIVLHQKQRHAIWREGVLNLVFTVLLCYLSQMVMPAGMRESMISSFWYQASTVVTGILLLMGAAFLSLHISGSWYAVSGRKTGKELYRQKKNYNYAVRRTSGIRCAVAKRIGRREIENEFPYWVLTVALYLQEDSVYQSIVHSLGEQNYFLRQEIKQLLERIYEKPDDIQSYLSFCCFADIEELHTIMKLLYAVNTNGVQHTKRQILFLVEQSNAVMDQTEQNALSNRRRALDILTQFPFVIGGMKVVSDLFLFLMSALWDIQDFM